MKNKIALLLGIGAVLGLGLILIIFAGKAPDELAKHPVASDQPIPLPSIKASPTLTTPDVTSSPIPSMPGDISDDQPSPEPEASAPATEVPEGTEAKPYTAIGDRTDIPVLDIKVDSRDLTSSVFSDSDEVERKYLSETQIAELEETVLSAGAHPEAEFPNKQSYTFEWYKSDNFEQLIPDLPTQVPLYAVSRDRDVQVFEKVKKIVKDFGLKATVLRMNEEKYAAFDMQTGDHLLGYDLTKDIFELAKLNIPMVGKETPMNALEWFLYEKGLLRFPYHAVFLEKDDGSKVVRFNPDLELPVIRFDYVEAKGNPVDDGGEEPFLVGVGETIDAVIDRAGNLRELYAFFPNLEKWKDLDIMSKPEIAKLIQEGNFAFGDVKIQHPSALTLAQRQEFYNLAAGENMKLTEAELYYVECGYFQETEKNYQLFYQPVCMAYGDGYLGDYGADFGVILSIAK